jgi:Protein of unknown function (DUF3175)
MAAKSEKTKSKDTKSEDKKSPRRWSANVTNEIDALDLEPDLFKSNDPKGIADSVKASAEHSRRRKASPFRSAMSMLTFYANRAGRNLPAARKRVIERAKAELRKAFGRS